MKKLITIIIAVCLLTFSGCAEQGVVTFTVKGETDMQTLTGIDIPLDSVRKTTATAPDEPYVIIEFNFMDTLYSESDYSIDAYRMEAGGENAPDDFDETMNNIRTDNSQILASYIGYEKLIPEYMELLRKNYSPSDDSYFFDMHISTHQCYNTRTENGETTTDENAIGQLFAFKDKGIMVYIAKIPCPVEFKIGV